MTKMGKYVKMNNGMIESLKNWYENGQINNIISIMSDLCQLREHSIFMKMGS